MKIRTWAATAVLTAALIAVPSVAFAAPAPAPEDATASSGECNFGQRVMNAWRQLPDELQADLKELRQLEPSARRDAAIAIRHKALAGDYGPAVQENADRIKDRRLLALQTMPQNLKDDLRELRDADPDDRRALARQIADDALAGDYGTQAQQTVEKIRATDFWQDCLAD